MQEFEPKKKVKIFNKEFLSKNAYIFVIAIVLIFGVAYGYTFFIQNKKIASGSITTAALTVNFTDRSLSASSLSVPTTDQEGLLEFSKSVTITNQTSIDGRVKLTLTRTSGLDLTDLRYALIVNGAIQTIDDVPSDGIILESAIMGNEVINVEVRLWPKTTYSGSATTFVGELTPEIKYLGPVASSISSPAGKYVNFNCNAGTCEVWQIVKVEDGRLVLTTQANYENATSRTNSNKYDSTLGLHDDGNLITSVSTDGKNVYLAKTVKINGGSGTQADPYTLINSDFREPDKKVIAQITYKDGQTTVGTQNVYYNETNYVSQVLNDPNFQGWTDGTNNYQLGSTITISSDTNLTAIAVQTLKNRIQTLCDDSSVAYVKKYDALAHGAAIDTSDGSGSEDICYYTSPDSNRNSLAEQNGNVIFGDYCWQIVRTTADGGVKLIYNGLKTNSGKCTSDADNNYSSDPRQTTDGVVGNTQSSISITSDNKYGTGFEIYDNGGTPTYRLTKVFTANWSGDSDNDGIADYLKIIGTYTCLSNTDTTCTTLYYVGPKQDYNNASVVKYTIGTSDHYSQIGKSPYNPYDASPALVGYMFNDVYNKITMNMPREYKKVLNHTSMAGTNYYYGDKVYWNGTAYELLMNDDTPPTSTSTWVNIRGSARGKYTCTNGNTLCDEVMYIFDNSSDYYAINMLLSNNETIANKQVTWTYGTGITKSGNTYTLTNTGTKTFTLADWYTTYDTDPEFKNIYICEDFTSTTCPKAYYITTTDNYEIRGNLIYNIFYFASDVNYNSSTNTYSYDTNGTVIEVFDWNTQYNTINNNHYMCENYSPTTHECDTNEPMYYVNQTTNTSLYYTKLTGLNNIGEALVNMLSKDTTINNQVVTVNKYNSAIKGVIDNWYKQNIDNNNLTSYLDNNAVYCNDRTISSYGGWSPNGSTTQNTSLRFKYDSNSTSANINLGCGNMTDRFSVNNNKAKLTYPVGLLTEPEIVLMGDGYARTNQNWWLASPKALWTTQLNGTFVNTNGGNGGSNTVKNVYGLRPVITLKPGIEISSGDGTYNSPYVIKTTSN